MTLSEPIERLALLGWRLYPASSRGRSGCIKSATDLATYDIDQLAAWAREFPGCNWRVVMEGSGIWAMDCDAPGPTHSADGIAAMAELVHRHGPLPHGPRSRSGGGGLGLFFCHNGEPIAGKTGTPAPGLDPRRGRLSITVPPSIHYLTRQPYRWIVAPWDVSPPDAPAWLLDAVKPPPEPQRKAFDPEVTTDARARRRLIRAITTIETAPSGAANDTLNREAFAVGRHVAARVLSESEAISQLYSAARARNIPPHEARATLKSAFRSAYQKPLEAAWR